MDVEPGLYLLTTIYVINLFLIAFNVFYKDNYKKILQIKSKDVSLKFDAFRPKAV